MSSTKNQKRNIPQIAAAGLKDHSSELKEARKPGLIMNQLDELGNTICVAHNALSALESKLQPVRCSVPRMDGKGASGDPASGSDVRVSLLGCTARVNELIARLQLLIDEVEV
jgi:hypothetical protein